MGDHTSSHILAPFCDRRATRKDTTAEIFLDRRAELSSLGTLPRLDQDQEPGAPGDRARDADCFEQTQFKITVVKIDPPPEAFNGGQPHRAGFVFFVTVIC
jgi:hypothetical protein